MKKVFHYFLYLHTSMLFLILGLPCLQGQTYEWSKRMGGTDDDYGNSIALDATGNVYTTGSFRDTVDFDPGPGIANLISVAGPDGFIQKLDSAGNFLWAKSIGGIDGEHINSLALDAAGNVYTTGCFWGTVDFDPGTGVANLTSAGFNDIFILKLDSQGNFLWVKQMGGTDGECNLSIGLDTNGNVYTTGWFSDTTDFDPGPGTANLISAGSSDIFLQKIDSSGNFLWAKRMGGTDSERGNSIGLDLNGNVYSTGRFRGTADFDPGPGTVNLTSGGNYDFFVLKLDSNGNFLWARSTGGSSSDESISLALSVNGNVYTTGWFNNTVDFDPGAGTANLTSAGVEDIFIQTLDASGNFLWARQMGGISFDIGRSLALDNSGNVYCTGSFRDTVDFDPGPGTAFLVSGDIGGAFDDIFILKLDSQGNFLWAKQMGGPSDAISTSLALDDSRNVYTLGSFRGIADFDPGSDTVHLTSAGGSDIFVSKLSQCSPITTSTLTDTACHTYTFNGQTFTSSGTYTQTLTNSAGCDRVITLNLMIQNPVSSLTVTACDSFTLNNQTYNTSGIYTQTLTTPSGCDSVITLNLTIPDPMTTLVDTACDSYLFHNTIYTSSGIYTFTDTTPDGCDSVTTLYLHIQTIDTSVVLNGLTFTSNASGFNLTYQWIECDFGNAIPGETNQSFTVTSSGNYAVILSDNWCLDTSDCYFISIIGIDPEFATGIKIFPNPATDFLSIEAEETFPETTIELIHITSKEMYQISVDRLQKMDLDIRQIEPGLYFLRITSQGKMAVFKVMKV